MCDLRSISLCNVIYKIILKVLANCLKPLMSNCISQEHYAFVENKSIIDNVSKALDGVDWNFLKRMMINLCFHNRWANTISICMESIYYQMLVNGEREGHVVPKRGLKQGDPLSRYLFILWEEIHSSYTFYLPTFFLFCWANIKKVFFKDMSNFLDRPSITKSPKYFSAKILKMGWRQISITFLKSLKAMRFEKIPWSSIYGWKRGRRLSLVNYEKSLEEDTTMVLDTSLKSGTRRSH